MLELIPGASLQGPWGGTLEAPEAEFVGFGDGDFSTLGAGFLVSGTWNT